LFQPSHRVIRSAIAPKIGLATNVREGNYFLPFSATLLLSNRQIRYPPVVCSYEGVKSVGSHRQSELGTVGRHPNGACGLGQYYVPHAIHEHEQTTVESKDFHAGKQMIPLPFHVRPSAHKFRSSSGEGKLPATPGQLQKLDKNRKEPSEEEKEADYVRFCLNPYSLPRRGIASAYGCPGAFDGYLPIILQPLPPIPIQNTGRNAELFHFCKSYPDCHWLVTDIVPVHDVLSPYIGAIDGLNQSTLITDDYLPWMRNSRLMAYTAIISASAYQAEVRGLDVSNHAESIAIRVEIISIINERLTKNPLSVSDETISVVMHLLTHEASLLFPLHLPFIG